MNGLNEISSKVVIGMDEVVNVFVSKYEDDLYVRKDELSDSIKDVKKSIESVGKECEKSVDESYYVSNNKVLGISSKVDNVRVSFDDKKKSGSILVDVLIKDDERESSGYRSNCFNKVFEVEVKESVCKKYFKLIEEKNGLEIELMSVMNLIKDISRKERKIRSKISEMKLNESGFSELLNNKDVLKLIKLEQFLSWLLKKLIRNY